MKAKEEQNHLIAQIFCFEHQIFIAFGGKGGFNGKCRTPGEEPVNALKHKLPGLDCNFFRLEWGKAFGNFIGVDKFSAIMHLRQNAH